MTGWRLGYLYLQDAEGMLADVWDGILRLSRVRLCASTPAQVAAVEALRGPQDHIREMVSKLKARRDYSLKRINEMPKLHAAKPDGAFYLFPRINLNGTKWRDDAEFVSELLKETGVLVVHGSGFDPTYGKNHFRTVFLPQESVLEEAFDAIEGFMKRHTQ
jgi:aspartate/methionine/tyrosine aminotransferase